VHGHTLNRKGKKKLALISMNELDYKSLIFIVLMEDKMYLHNMKNDAYLLRKSNDYIHIHSHRAI